MSKILFSVYWDGSMRRFQQSVIQMLLPAPLKVTNDGPVMHRWDKLTRFQMELILAVARTTDMKLMHKPDDGEHLVFDAGVFRLSVWCTLSWTRPWTRRIRWFETAVRMYTRHGVQGSRHWPKIERLLVAEAIV